MKTFHNPHHAGHAGQQEMFRGRMVPCHEVPARLDFVLAEMQRRPLGPLTPPAVDDATLDIAIARVHSARYLDFLARAWDDWVAMEPANAQRDALPSVWPLSSRHGFRNDVLPGNFAARLGLFAFTRPPGHHAGPDFLGGYCFLNNAAIAAQALRDAGHARVAVLDVDYHHGNGTQTIFYERPDVLTVSIHGDPATEYPFFLGHADERGAGEGTGFNLNLPLPRGTGFASWRAMLDTALRAVRDFGASALVVPMGLDTFEGDPISGFTLQSADYTAIGAALAGAGLPAVFTFEGGYAVDEVGTNAVNLLEGFQQAS